MFHSTKCQEQRATSFKISAILGRHISVLVNSMPINVSSDTYMAKHTTHIVSYYFASSSIQFFFLFVLYIHAAGRSGIFLTIKAVDKVDEHANTF